MRTMKLISVAYHRNGVFGEGFHAVTFRWHDGRKFRTMLATVFSTEEVEDGQVHPCNGRLAVLDAEMAAHGIVEFGVNSWRADEFEPELRQWIAQHQVQRSKQLVALTTGGDAPTAH